MILKTTYWLALWGHYSVTEQAYVVLSGVQNRIPQTDWARRTCKSTSSGPCTHTHQHTSFPTRWRDTWLHHQLMCLFGSPSVESSRYRSGEDTGNPWTPPQWIQISLPVVCCYSPSFVSFEKKKIKRSLWHSETVFALTGRSPYSVLTHKRSHRISNSDRVTLRPWYNETKWGHLIILSQYRQKQAAFQLTKYQTFPSRTKWVTAASVQDHRIAPTFWQHPTWSEPPLP